MTTTRRVSAALAAITLVAVGVMPSPLRQPPAYRLPLPPAPTARPSTAPAPRASSTYTSISPSRAVNNKQVRQASARRSPSPGWPSFAAVASSGFERS